MNSNLAVISTLVKSDISERCIINFLTNVSSRALRNYLECGNIYKGNYPKKKADLIEMIIYGCINGKLINKQIEDISMKQANLILNKNAISTKSLPGYGNARLRKKEIITLTKEKSFMKVWYYFEFLVRILSVAHIWFFSSNVNK